MICSGNESFVYSTLIIFIVKYIFFIKIDRNYNIDYHTYKFNLLYKFLSAINYSFLTTSYDVIQHKVSEING